jgi:Flp pilus assembly protein TadG
MTQDESGGIAVIVAILLVVLVGTTAFVVDIGDVNWERRMLQNSADAAALAVAVDCSQGDCAAHDATAANYASENNWRDAFVVSVVGADGVSPPEPTDGEVTVTVRTGDTEGEGRLRQWFSAVLGQTEGLATGASATAVWGAVAMTDATLPLTISMCDWQAAVGIEFDTENLENNDLSSLPEIKDLPSGSYYGKTKGVTIRFHNAKDDTDACEAKPGHDANDDDKLPAGWGWLAEDETDGCAIKNVGSEEDGSFWAEKDPGNNPAPIQCLKDALGSATVIPVFIDFERTNPRDRYLLYAPAAFYLTGYRFPGQEAPSATLRPCNPPETCISGHFVRRTEAGQLPTGDIDLGIQSVALKE